jgi:hypothetical protein
MVKKRNSYKTLIGEPGGKRFLGGPRRRWMIILKTGMAGVAIIF